jgi:hypothetical protein
MERLFHCRKMNSQFPVNGRLVSPEVNLSKFPAPVINNAYEAGNYSNASTNNPHTFTVTVNASNFSPNGRKGSPWSFWGTYDQPGPGFMYSFEASPWFYYITSNTNSPTDTSPQKTKFELNLKEGNNITDIIDSLSNNNYKSFVNTASTENLKKYSNQLNLVKMTKRGRAMNIFRRVKNATRKNKPNVEKMKIKNNLINAVKETLKLPCELSKQYMEQGQSNVTMKYFDSENETVLKEELPIIINFCNMFNNDINNNTVITDELRDKYNEIINETSNVNVISIITKYFKTSDLYYNLLALFELKLMFEPFKFDEDGKLNVTITNNPDSSDYKNMVYYLNTTPADELKRVLDKLSVDDLIQITNIYLNNIKKIDNRQILQNKLIRFMHLESKERAEAFKKEIEKEIGVMETDVNIIEEHKSISLKGLKLVNELKNIALDKTEKLKKHIELQKILNYLDVPQLPPNIDSEDYITQINLKLKFFKELHEKTAEEINAIQGIIQTGKDLYKLIDNYIKGNKLKSLYYGTKLLSAWFGRGPVKYYVDKYKRLSTQNVTYVAPPTELLKNVKPQSKITGFTNILKNEIYVNLQITNDNNPTMYKHNGQEFKATTTTAIQRAKIVLENNKYYVTYLDISDKGKIYNAKRALPFPVSVLKIIKDGEYKELPMKMIVKHQISKKKGEIQYTKLAKNISSEFLASGRLKMPETKTPIFTPWASISYEANLYADKDNNVFIWYLNEPSTRIPIYVKDQKWQTE